MTTAPSQSDAEEFDRLVDLAGLSQAELLELQHKILRYIGGIAGKLDEAKE